jgi:cytochrome c-type biogenesis protein
MEALVLNFTLGLASAASPCLLPLYPGFLAYLAGNAASLGGRRATGLLGLFVLAGVLSAMVLVGIVLTLLAVPLGSVLGYLIPLIIATLALLGVLLLAGVNPFARLATVRVPVVTNPYAQAYVYGVLLGPLALPCAGAFLVAIFATSLGVADAATRLVGFLAYGLGFGLPLVVLSLLAGARAREVARFVARHHRVIEVVSGVVLLAAAAVELVTQWDNIRLTFGL